MRSRWKALSDDSRREILILLKKDDMIPTEILIYSSIVCSINVHTLLG